MYFKKIIFIFFLISISLFAQGKNNMKIFSNSFNNNENVPEKFTCNGKNISPHLKWENYPENTRSFALIMDDPDAPAGTWVHWIVYNIPSNINELKESVKLNLINATEGKNSWGNNSYGGPCPPPGNTHRYFFKIYALNIKTNFPEGLTKSELLQRIKSHIISEAHLIGLYKR